MTWTASPTSWRDVHRADPEPQSVGDQIVDQHPAGCHVDRIYSGVPAELVGLKQVIEIGHMAGRSNVICWLKQRGIEPKEGLVTAIFDEAKRGTRVLTDDEVMTVIAGYDAGPSSSDSGSSATASL